MKNHKAVKKIKDIYSKLTGSATRLYLTTFSLFIFIFGFIFISPTIMGGSYSYENTKIDDFETVNNNVRIALVNKEFNPEKNLMRLDYLIEDTGITSTIQNMNYEMLVQDIETRKSHKIEMIRVNDNYLVVLVDGLKEGFSVLSNTIKPYYIHPEIEKNSGDLEGREVKTYVNEEDEIINTALEKLDEKGYKIEYLTFQQEELKKQIDGYREEIAAIDLKSSESNKQIDTLKSELEYLTEQEKIEQKNKINTQLSSINQNDKKKKEIEDLIKNAEEKIKLLEERKEKI